MKASALACALILGACDPSSEYPTIPVEPTPDPATPDAAQLDCENHGDHGDHGDHDVAPDPTAACEALCGVPGGIEECPVGTPCPKKPVEDDALQRAFSQSLCAQTDPSACPKR